MLTPIAESVLKARYLRQLSDGTFESFESMLERVARYIASAEKYDKEMYAEKFFKIMRDLKFLPNSPTLMNSGNPPGSNQLAACFVLPIEDDMTSIFETLKKCALIHKSGGGVGINYSTLRPRNSAVGSTNGIASGPVSFMKIFDAAIEQVKQGGKRRGANIGLLRADHPDIVEFIKSKLDDKTLSNFNISIEVTNPIMRKMLGKDADNRIPLVNHRNEAVGHIDGKELFDLVVDSAWQTGDPGLIFIDEINKFNPTPHVGRINCVNPCGEQPLLDNEACILGSINLSKFIDLKNNDIDYEALKETVRIAVRFLDNAIDVCDFPFEEITNAVMNNRKIGLGVMGFADVLAQLMIPYDSDDGLEIAQRIQKTINDEAIAESIRLGTERGVYPNNINNDGRRNATVTTIAPTGTLSIIADCSSGIEPYFALAYERVVLEEHKFDCINKYLMNALDRLKLKSNEILDDIINTGAVSHIKQIPEYIRNIFKTAHEIHPEWHIKMQSAFQKHVENAVSKTVNLPHKATREDIARCYELAYKYRLKGITVFRDGCKSSQVLQIKDSNNTAQVKIQKRKRPDILHGPTYKVLTGYGDMYVTVNVLDGKPFEVFTVIGKAGSSITAKTEAISRLISLALRSNIDVSEIISQLKGISGGNHVFSNGVSISSIPDGIAYILEKYYSDSNSVNTKFYELCPQCGNGMTLNEGCRTCYHCGYSSCG